MMRARVSRHVVAIAAMVPDHVRAQQLFGDMISGCIECHSRYARDRFPGHARSPQVGSSKSGDTKGDQQ